LNRKRAICFVDDDEEEIRRFRKYMGDRYIIGAGRTLNDALKELQGQGRRKPDLFLLDLYYGPSTKEDMRARISDAYEKLSAEGMKLQVQLLQAGQSTKGGFQLAEEAQQKHKNVARVFFSRKAFVKDCEEAHERGIAVLKKPDPGEEDSGRTRADRYDAAFRRHLDEIFRHIDRMMDQSTWWMRHRQLVAGFGLGVGASVAASFIFEFLKIVLRFP